MVQGLGLGAFLVPGQGTKILQAMRSSQKKKKNVKSDHIPPFQTQNISHTSYYGWQDPTCFGPWPPLTPHLLQLPLPSLALSVSWSLRYPVLPRIMPE